MSSGNGVPRRREGTGVAIDNFEVQPYPLWAVLLIDDYRPVPLRVIGWQAAERRIQPVLAMGAKSIVAGPERHVEFYDSMADAQLQGPKFAERMRRGDSRGVPDARR